TRTASLPATSSVTPISRRPTGLPRDPTTSTPTATGTFSGRTRMATGSLATATARGTTHRRNRTTTSIGMLKHGRVARAVRPAATEAVTAGGVGGGGGGRGGGGGGGGGG